MTEEETSVDQRNPDCDLSYLAGWLCGIPLFGLVGALDFLCREMNRKAFQALLCGLPVLGVYILCSSLLENEPVWMGRLIIIGAWIVLPPVTLYYLRTLEWPAPAPHMRVGGPWVFVVDLFAVFGILLAIADSAHRDYEIRAKAWAAIAETKQRVEQYARLRHKLPATHADVAGDKSVDSKYIESLSVGANGAITIRLSQFVGSVAGKSVRLMPHLNADVLTWSCDGGTLADKYRSPECRRQPPGRSNTEPVDK